MGESTTGQSLSLSLSLDKKLKLSSSAMVGDGGTLEKEDMKQWCQFFKLSTSFPHYVMKDVSS